MQNSLGFRYKNVGGSVIETQRDLHYKNSIGVQVIYNGILSRILIFSRLRYLPGIRLLKYLGPITI